MACLYPNELLVEIFANLTKADCKTARLGSIGWSVLAAEFVFDTVQIGPGGEGLQMFTIIAEHPILSKRVINLSFESRLFERDIGRNKYLRLLLRQTRLELHLYPEQHTLSDVNGLTANFCNDSPVATLCSNCVLPQIRRHCYPILGINTSGSYGTHSSSPGTFVICSVLAICSNSGTLLLFWSSAPSLAPCSCSSHLLHFWHLAPILTPCF